jgi:hypothetical protein
LHVPIAIVGGSNFTALGRLPTSNIGKKEQKFKKLFNLAKVAARCLRLLG